ncbi:YcgL domain-containing protein [Marinicella sp. S1101]|uniref:YcgL domain-containing protein n=1 Tax=Marinicella marina TaxID=2996016 RepID=UPI002260C9B9|nr:YcgL domain-containing protein [Marinicella marina]MCX7554104.1 YcgL domain-containing protein [Marinicella marina]MDJ1141203.1 YcgL domain-containing protein [Marinicella marina]
MIAHIYRSEKKNGAYLYLAEGFDFSEIPSELAVMVGACIKVMELDLAQRKQLASEKITTVKNNLKEQGYHLQMPPQTSVGVINYGV